MRLKELRKQYDFLQSDVAELLDVDRSVVSSWERGLSSPSFDEQCTLAIIFSVSVDYLMGFSDDPKMPAHGVNYLNVIDQQVELNRLKHKVSKLEQENARLVEDLSKERASLTTTANEKNRAEAELERSRFWGRIFKIACVFCVWAFVIAVGRIDDLQGDLKAYKQKTKNLTEQVEILSDQVIALAGKLPKSIPTSSTSRSPLSSKDATIMVWIPATGKRYHDSKACAGNSPREVTLAEAKARGYTSCGRCDPPY